MARETRPPFIKNKCKQFGSRKEANNDFYFSCLVSERREGRGWLEMILVSVSFFVNFFLVKEMQPPFLKKRNSHIESAFSFMNSAAAAIFHSGLIALSISVFISFWLGHGSSTNRKWIWFPQSRQFWTWSSTKINQNFFYFGKFFPCLHSTAYEMFLLWPFFDQLVI